jgi:hypothetical protein
MAQVQDLRVQQWPIPQIVADMTTQKATPVPTQIRNIVPKGSQKQSTKRVGKQKQMPSTSTSTSACSTTTAPPPPLKVTTGTQTSSVVENGDIDADTIHHIFHDPAFPAMVGIPYTLYIIVQRLGKNLSCS